MKNRYILLQPIRCILFILSFVLLALFLHTDYLMLSKWWSIIASFINIITIIILCFLCKGIGVKYSELVGYKKGSTKKSNLILMILIILFVGMGGMYLAGLLCYGEFPYMPTIMVQPIPPILAIANILILPLTTTLAEDGLYLGIGVNHINNKWCAILVPAFFYAAQHSFIPTIFDAQYIFYRFLSFLPLTVLICYLYYKKRDPVPFMAGHFILNIATAIQIIVTSVSPDIYELMVKL